MCKSNISPSTQRVKKRSIQKKEGGLPRERERWKRACRYYYYVNHPFAVLLTPTVTAPGNPGRMDELRFLLDIPPLRLCTAREPSACTDYIERERERGQTKLCWVYTYDALVEKRCQKAYVAAELLALEKLSWPCHRPHFHFVYTHLSPPFTIYTQINPHSLFFIQSRRLDKLNKKKKVFISMLVEFFFFFEIVDCSMRGIPDGILYAQRQRIKKAGKENKWEKGIREIWRRYSWLEYQTRGNCAPRLA